MTDNLRAERRLLNDQRLPLRPWSQYSQDGSDTPRIALSENATDLTRRDRGFIHLEINFQFQHRLIILKGGPTSCNVLSPVA